MKTTNHTSAPVWFITGASRGFGSEFARVALEHGCKVAATARKPEAVTQTLGEHENLLPIALDVTNQEQIDDAVKKQSIPMDALTYWSIMRDMVFLAR